MAVCRGLFEVGSSQTGLSKRPGATDHDKSSSPPTGRGGTSAESVRMPAPRFRNLWQVPVLLLGISALVTVYLTRQTPCFTKETTPEQELLYARKALGRPHARLGETARRLQQLIENADPDVAWLGEAHFLLGSAYLNLAETSPVLGPPIPGEESGGERSFYLREAFRCLEKAKMLGVPNEDRHSLAFRLAKTLHLTDGRPDRVIELLTKSVANLPDVNLKAEGYGILSRAYLRLPQPNTNKALEFNQALLALPLLRSDVVDPARLLGGELLLQSGQRERGRALLQRIDPTASPEHFVKAQYLLARSFQEEGRWEEAAKLWKERLSQSTDNIPGAPPIRYWLGLCYANMGRPADAVQVWETDDLWKRLSADGRAAALGLAKQRVLIGQPGAALEALEAAVRDLKGPADWPQNLVTLPQACEVVEQLIDSLRQGGRLEHAIRAADLYERLAAPGRAEDLGAELSEQRARNLLAGASQSSNPEREEQAVRDHFVRAGEKYLLSARKLESFSEQLQRLWKSSHCFLRGGEHQRAVEVLEQVKQREKDPEKLGQLWFLLGEARRALQRYEQALLAYELCWTLPGPFQNEARFQWATLKIKMIGGPSDDAEAALLRILEGPADPRMQEKTLFALGDLYFRRGEAQENLMRFDKALADYEQARYRLDMALKQFPDCADSLTGHWQLAESYWRLAELELRAKGLTAPRSSQLGAWLDKNYRSRMEQALAEYEKVCRCGSQRPAMNPRSAEEKRYVRQALFAVPECHIRLGNYAKARDIYQSLAAQFHHSAECLHALAGMRQCYWLLSKQEGQNSAQYMQKHHAMLEEIRNILDKLSDEALSPPASAWSRQQWQAWLKEEAARDAKQGAIPGARPAPNRSDRP